MCARVRVVVGCQLQHSCSRRPPGDCRNVQLMLRSLLCSATVSVTSRFWVRLTVPGCPLLLPSLLPLDTPQPGPWPADSARHADMPPCPLKHRAAAQARSCSQLGLSYHAPMLPP
jgi:hypothetical protein